MEVELAGPGPRPTKPAGWPIARLLPVVLVGLIFFAMLPVIGIAYFAAPEQLRCLVAPDQRAHHRHDRAAPAGPCRAGARPARLYQRGRGQGRDRLRRPRAMARFFPGRAGRGAAGRRLRRHPGQRRAAALHARGPQHASGAAREPALHRSAVRPGPHPERTAMGRAAMVAHRRRADPAGHRADPRARAIPRRHRRRHRHVGPVALPERPGAARRAQAVHPGRPRQGAGPSLARQGAGQRRAARPRAAVEAGRGQRSGAGRDVGARAERDLLAERRQEHRLGPLELGGRQQPWLDLPQDRRVPPGLADHRLSPGRPRIRRGRAGSCAAS